MAKGFNIEAKGLFAWNGADELVFEVIKDCMDDIRDDVATVSKSLVPRKSGKLESSQRVRRYYKNLEKCHFSISYTGENKAFDYATWTHNSNYNLGSGSQAKQPARSRFARGSLRVGKGYVSQIVEQSKDGWEDFISYTIDRKLKNHLNKQSKK